MCTLKKYLAGFHLVQNIKKLALCLIKQKFSLLQALWEIMDFESDQLEAKVRNSLLYIIAPWSSTHNVDCDYWNHIKGKRTF